VTSLADGKQAAEAATRKPRLLLLFADASAAVGLAQRLLSANYEVVLCPLSVPADGWAEKLEPDLVLLDLPPEQRQVLQVCEAVCAQTACPVIAICALKGELLISRLLALGVDDYLARPIGGRELCARIDALLRRLRRYGESPRTQHVGGLLLSSVDHSVEGERGKVYLSPIEFRLLSCLVSAPGKVLTHQTLLARVWGAEYGAARGSLHVYIRYLRQKLEEDPANPHLILNEWGVGYRLQPPQTPAG
jgi:DNA-binding response OmpR family regulator